MIPKRIDRSNKTSSFERLGHYVLEAKNEDSLILWTRTAEYVVDMKGDGEKVLWYRLSNCEAEIPAMAIAEILATQAENSRSKTDKTYHMVLSFPEGESPTKEQMEDIEDRMCGELGYSEHQRISAVHMDTDNIHLHVAINKVHPKTHNVHMPHWDFYTMDRVCAELEQKHGLTLDNRIGQGKGHVFDIEAHHGKPSFIRWVQSSVKDQLRHVTENGRSWQDLHAVLGEYGLHIRKKGAGLVIGVDASKRAIKASSIDRQLSLKALTDRFGEFEPSRVQVEVKQRYQETKHQDVGTNELFKQFQTYQNEVKQKRSSFKELREKDFKTFQEELKQWASKARNQIKRSDSASHWRREAYSHIAKERQRSFDEYKKAETERKNAFYGENPVLNWDQYLMKSAAEGNVSALARLRNKGYKQEQFSALFLSADNLEAAKNIIYEHLKPFTRKNGEMVYRVKDGGSVTDEKHLVRVDEQTSGATFLALSLATEKFQGQSLKINGTDEFKRQIVEFAVKYELDVTFKNQELEEERQRLTQEKQQKQVQDNLSPALSAYLSERNNLREKIQSIVQHRLWNKADAGEATFQGLRNLTDGSQVTLWMKNQEMLVKPVFTPDEPKGLKIGQVVKLSENGKVLKPRGRSR